MAVRPMSGWDYGWVDRLLHRVALGGRFGVAMQKSLAELEGGLAGMRSAVDAPRRPVFVSALPRAGTTLLLDMLASVPEFATHTYRDMPFVLAPLLWGRLSCRFRRTMAPRVRAHDDGMTVDYDSPEAFEEVLWLAFWSDKYRLNAIQSWRADDRNAEFEAFFARHMHMLIATRTGERGMPVPERYLSKNNANIARLELLPEIYPDCQIVVPLREPLEQCNSLLRQHRRFLRLHADDPFARRYMGWIGHFEFGSDARPIDFAGDGGAAYGEDRDRLDYWLRYWISAQRSIAAATAGLVRLDYAELIEHPVRSLCALADSLDLANASELVDQAGRIRPPGASTARAPLSEPIDPSLLNEAAALYADARKSCVNRCPA